MYSPDPVFLSVTGESSPTPVILRLDRGIQPIVFSYTIYFIMGLDMLFFQKASLQY
jgi:hypothetical protein